MTQRWENKMSKLYEIWQKSGLSSQWVEQITKCATNRHVGLYGTYKRCWVKIMYRVSFIVQNVVYKIFIFSLPTNLNQLNNASVQ